MKNIAGLLSFLIIAGCHTNPLPNSNELTLSSNEAHNHNSYAAVREYEQTHGLFDWRTAPPVT